MNKKTKTKIFEKRMGVEGVILAMILFDNSCLKFIKGYLKPEHLQTQPAKIIYKSMLSLEDRKEEIDLVNIKKYFDEKANTEFKEFGGLNYLIMLIDLPLQTRTAKIKMKKLIDFLIETSKLKF